MKGYNSGFAFTSTNPCYLTILSHTITLTHLRHPTTPQPASLLPSAALHHLPTDHQTNSNVTQNPPLPLPQNFHLGPFVSCIPGPPDVFRSSCLSLIFLIVAAGRAAREENESVFPPPPTTTTNANVTTNSLLRSINTLPTSTQRTSRAWSYAWLCGRSSRWAEYCLCRVDGVDPSILSSGLPRPGGGRHAHAETNLGSSPPSHSLVSFFKAWGMVFDSFLL